MTNATFDVGIAGTGSIAKSAHIPAWSETPKSEVVAIADPDDGARISAINRAESVGINGLAEYDTVSEMVHNEALDLVDVTIPPGDAKIDAIQMALDAGCNVTCQKPFVIDFERGLELVNYAKERSQYISANQQARTAGAFARAKEMIAAGDIGTLRTIRLSADFPFSGENRWLNFSSHSFDLVRFWADKEPTRVMAWHKRQTSDDRYLFAVWLDFDGSLSAEIWDELSSSTNLRWSFRLMGDSGTIRGHEAYKDHMFPARIAYTPAGTQSECVSSIASSYVPDAFRNYFTQLIEALDNDETPPTSGQDNLKTLQIAFAARESVKRGQWVDVPSGE